MSLSVLAQPALLCHSLARVFECLSWSIEPEFTRVITPSAQKAGYRIRLSPTFFPVLQILLFRHFWIYGTGRLRWHGISHPLTPFPIYHLALLRPPPESPPGVSPQTRMWYTSSSTTLFLLTVRYIFLNKILSFNTDINNGFNLLTLTPHIWLFEYVWNTIVTLLKFSILKRILRCYYETIINRYRLYRVHAWRNLRYNSKLWKVIIFFWAITSENIKEGI